MHAALLVLASAVVGVDWGYRPLPAGGIEYIVQVEPQALDDLAGGGSEIVSQVPPELFDIRQFRITVGKQKLPRGGRVATPSKQQQAADGVQVTPAALTGGGNEHVVELDRAAIDQMKRDMDLVYEVQNVRRYRLRLGPSDRWGKSDASASQAKATPTGPATDVAPAVIETAKVPQAEVAEPRAALTAPPAERDSAPPFVPDVVRDPFPLKQSDDDRAQVHAPALPQATPQPANTAAPARAEPMPPAREPEPLKIELAPAIESSPRPLRPAVAESAAPPIQPTDKPNSTNIAIPDSFPEPIARKAPLPERQVDPQGGREPTAKHSTNDPFPGEIQMPAPTQRAEQPPPEVRRPIVPAGQAADWPPAAPVKQAAPAKAADVEAARGVPQTDPFADKPTIEPQAAPIAEPKATSPHNDTPAWPSPQPKESDAKAPQPNRGPTDPFPALETNPLRGPGLQGSPNNEPSSPRDTDVGSAAGSAPGGGSSPSGVPTGPGSGAAPPFGTMPPVDATPSAFSSRPPLGTAAPPAETPKSNGDPFAPAFGATNPSPGGPGLSSSGPQDGGFTQTSSRQAPLANDMSSAPDRFPISQPPSHQLTSFGTDAGPEARPIATTVDRGQFSDEQPSGPAAATPPADKKPWWGLTGALVFLFASLGGNAYLGWMNWDLRRQYAALLDMFKQQRANKSRA